VMSALPPKADIRQRDFDVRFVPKADMDGRCSLSLGMQFMSVGPDAC
jgi:hypothetical protein